MPRRIPDSRLFDVGRQRRRESAHEHRPIDYDESGAARERQDGKGGEQPGGDAGLHEDVGGGPIATYEFNGAAHEVRYHQRTIGPSRFAIGGRGILLRGDGSPRGSPGRG